MPEGAQALWALTAYPGSGILVDGWLSCSWPGGSRLAGEILDWVSLAGLGFGPVAQLVRAHA
jgi:hypothetical protein